MNPDSKYNAVAVDVSKASLQVQTQSQSFECSNDAEGHARLLKALKDIPNTLVVFEASGGYEKALQRFLGQAKVACCLVNPRRVRAFALSEGIKAKTDPIDADVLLRFAQEKKLKPTAPPSPDQEQLAALMDRRSQLCDLLAKEKNRLEKAHSTTRLMIKDMIQCLEQHINKIELTIKKCIKKNPSQLELSDAMQEVQGVGQITAWTILAYMPEMTQLNRNETVAMAGLAPFNRDSGQTQKPRRISGGRAKVRNCLYMAAQTAARFNPVIQRYAKGLEDRGKPYKCIMVAVMRKLLLHLRSIMKKLENSIA